MASFLSKLSNTLKDPTLGLFGKVTKKLNLPELGISEALGGNKDSLKNQTQQNIKAAVTYLPTAAKVVSKVASVIPSKSATAEVKGSSTSDKKDNNKDSNKSSGGSNNNGNGGNGGGNNGPVVDLTPPITPDTTEEDQQGLQTLRDAYNQATSDLQNQEKPLDESYNIGKADIENAVADTETAANTQKDTETNRFSDILKNIVKTYQDTNRQRQGMYAGLGTMDSSSFGEDQYRADQNQAELQTKTELEKGKTLKGIDDMVTTFKKDATNKLSSLAIEYQKGKNAIKSAIANNDIQKASAINDYIKNIKEQASTIQNSIVNFANNAAYLKAQGYDVRTNMGGINGSGFASDVMNALRGITPTGSTAYSPSSEGSGYIGSDGKKYGSYRDYLKAIGAL